MTVVLALVAAAAYGVSDFVGGVVSKRTGPWTIAFVGQVAAGLALLLAGLLVDGSPRATDLAWSLVAGVGNGVGIAFLYRGLSSGRMGVVAPVSGVGSALVPVVVGVALGERPTLLIWLGVLAALPAIAMVASEPRSPGSSDEPADEPGGAPAASGVVDGVLAGLGFGVLFVALARIPESSGLLPLALNQALGAVVVLAVALALGQRVNLAQPRAALGVLPGVLGASATVAFLYATHAGLLTVAAVITALYPAGTILLAAVVLSERVHRLQGVGLVLCGAAVTLVALG